MSHMTPKRGRKILEDVGVLIFLGWDLNSALVFDSFLHYVDAKLKLSLEGVTQVYMGSMYNCDEHSMLIWSLYPPQKRPMIIDTHKAFGHIMTMKVGETNPIVIVDLGVNVAKLNKAQIQLLLKEKEFGRLENIILSKEIDHLKELLKKKEPQKLLTQGEISKPQTKSNKLKEEIFQLQAQLESVKTETLSTFVQKRFTKWMVCMDKYWEMYSKNQSAIKEHERLKKRLHDRLQELQGKDEVKSDVVKDCEGLIKAHGKYLEALRSKGIDFLSHG